MDFGGTSYENQGSIFPFKSGFAATGFSSSPGFTEGINLGPLSGDISDAFITYINYWPLSIQNTTVQSSQLQLYPNPANGIIKIVPPNEAGNLIVINCIGESIYSKGINQNETYININTASWASGIYIAKWQGEDGVVLTKKFIKN